MVFQENLKENEESKFFFCDSQHWPQVFKPFDAITVEFAVKCLGQYNTRQWLIPPANGIDFKIHNGYCYMSPVGVAPELIGDRVPQFMERAGHYFMNWNDLLENWHKKVKNVIDEMEAVKFEELPEVIDIEWVKSGKGLDPTYFMIQNYDKMIDLCYKTWNYHFEFLNLGYAAYLDFFGFCKETFPGIPDLSIAKMVQGVEVDLFRPDEELRKLAKLALELNVDSVICANDIDTALTILGNSDAGKNGLRLGKEQNILGSILHRAMVFIQPINIGLNTFIFLLAIFKIILLVYKKAKILTVLPKPLQLNVKELRKNTVILFRVKKLRRLLMENWAWLGLFFLMSKS